MTLVVCWERLGKGGTPELVVAADSRLSGGERWDACPKIFGTGRPDSVIAFAGETQRAYPILLSVVAGISSYASSATAATDIGDVATQSLHVANSMLQSFYEEPVDEAWASCQLVLAGWSWARLRFEVYELTPHAENGACSKFRKTLRHGDLGQGAWTVFGDGRSEFMRRFGGPARFKLPREEIDWSPLTKLADISADSGIDSVGGTPQVVKVLRRPAVEHYAVQIGEQTAIAGRRLADGEHHDLPVVRRDGSDFEWRVCR